MLKLREVLEISEVFFIVLEEKIRRDKTTGLTKKKEN